jgi:predicted DNA-binding transcriptional regulator YafY
VDRFDRSYHLHKGLRAARRPLTCRQLQQRLECSRATVMRLIEDLRDFLGAPLVYDRHACGYHFTSA